MPSVDQKGSLLAECYEGRLRFYAEWYSKHSFHETVSGFATDLANKVKGGLEPFAVKAIVSNGDFLDRYVNPVVFSSPAKLFAGGMGGSASLFATIFTALPDLAVMIAKRRIGLRDILVGCQDAIVAANSHVISYAGGKAPLDPYDRAFESAQALGSAFLLIYGANSIARGGLGAMRALARGAANTGSGAALVTAEGVVLGQGNAAAASGALVSSMEAGAGAGFLSLVGSSKNLAPKPISDATEAALKKYRAMDDKKLLNIAKTQRRIAAAKGKRRHILKKMMAEDTVESPTTQRRLSSDMTTAQKRAFAKVLVERSMEREAIRLLADWEHIENIKGVVRMDLTKRGIKLRPPTETSSVSSEFYSTLDDASLVRVAEKAGELMRHEIGRRSHVSRLWPDADPYVVREVANLGESRGFVEMMELARTNELLLELSSRGFADDSFILGRLFKSCNH